MPLDIGAALVPPLISGVSVGGPPQRLVSRADGGVGTYKCWASRCPSLASDSAVFLATPADGRSSRFSGLRAGDMRSLSRSSGMGTGRVKCLGDWLGHTRRRRLAGNCGLCVVVVLVS